MGQGQLAREGAPRVGDSREVLGHHPRASTWPWPCGSPGRHMGSDKLPSPPLLHPRITKRKDGAGCAGSHLIFGRSKAQAEGSGVEMKPEATAICARVCAGLSGAWTWLEPTREGGGRPEHPSPPAKRREAPGRRQHPSGRETSVGGYRGAGAGSCNLAGVIRQP